MNPAKILIVDDDDEIRNVLEILFTYEGFIIVQAATGKEALELIDDTFDLVVLDIMLPDLDGYNVCLSMRKKYNTPILFLSAKTSENDKNLGFISGCDDYITKPFSSIDLLNKSKAMLRRYTIYKGKEDYSDEQILKIHDVILDEKNGKVSRDGVIIPLTGIEYGILHLLAKNPKTIFSIQSIYENVWHNPYDFNANETVMVHIKNIRKKLAEENSDFKYITNVWGRGYCIEK